MGTLSKLDATPNNCAEFSRRWMWLYGGTYQNAASMWNVELQALYSHRLIDLPIETAQRLFKPDNPL